MIRRHFVGKGFTLVELLVVIAIIGVMVGLLLPAVQAAREASRRMSCSNKMKQLGLAFHNYHDTYNILPLGNSYAPVPRGNRRSWTVGLLPYLEQQAIYDQMDQNRWGLDATLNASGVSNRAIIQRNLAAVHCPSDADALDPRNRADNAGAIALALTNYAGSVGDHPNAGGIGFPGALVYGNNATTAATTRGVMSRYGWSARFAHITDGLSNTFFVGEVIPSYCNWQDWGHQSFATTAWPINHRNLQFQLGTLAPSDANNCITFRSRHPGGAHFLLGDGSVRFLADSMNFVTYRALASRAGAETLGEF